MTCGLRTSYLPLMGGRYEHHPSPRRTGGIGPVARTWLVLSIIR